ncbi:tRNA (guanine-N(7)-)-methyltransferase [Terrihabitans soli]|uniref:tRNA (guanine-N(7)-)-methyltransferase n=1 Tax=Terrihabitans soli TaxID=708113 RepID=A0A6S6QMZ3_9HYPH|nr:tRNA (guanosine(46)-N7)-methyltransferase TrmB [Terrihabitans soli]BCJ89287.1 tRNA (guanine-N(7)-)-methyltransferase [Terrihabitans soli]
MSDIDQEHRRRGALYGRRKGKPLRAGQAERFDTLLPRLKIDLTTPAPDDLRTLFGAPVDEFRLEIGFGGGEHLLHEAEQNPKTGFIGVEPFLNGMAKALAGIDERKIPNIRLFDNDAALLLDWLPPGCLSRVDLLYPDPWPKKRQFKRRFVSPENLKKIVRALKSGGEFRFASDIESYVEWTLAHVRAQPALQWTAEKADDWRVAWAGWPGTRYEAKAIRETRTPAYLIFRKI